MVDFSDWRVLSASGGCFCVLFITSIVLFSISWGVVEPRQYGIVYDNTYKKILTDRIKDSGRYLVGLGRSFIHYPRGHVTIEFKNGDSNSPQLACWSGNGQNVFLDLSLQISLRREELPRLYLQWGEHWLNWVVGWTQRIIKDTTTLFEALDFFEQRETIAATLLLNIKSQLEGTGYFIVHELQLREIDLQDPFEDAILDKILTLQSQRTEANNREVALIQAEIEKIGADAAAFAQVVLANATSFGDYLVKVREAEVQKNVTETKAQKYQELTESFGWNDEPDKLRILHYYIWSNLVKANEAKSSRSVVGIDNAVLDVA
ncbi:unnamed protein product [Vitrella brassicaformis CCMP3155]|uniref:Band 7 domain-containing protein n=1 Tax=Vitrella brassicaformis (strain CCMP3155) TaxID=1169540 RepID=A0A0G4GPI0_VITBC|nr:unnamed protein product [Vitrella brassicaformis CCMP3155]|eukprot:CEM32266.1 unnamed protein product [Vitrella brassicaformis CCMP3155]